METMKKAIERILTKVNAAWLVLTSDSFFVAAYFHKKNTLKYGGKYSWELLKVVEKKLDEMIWADDVQELEAREGGEGC